MNGTVEPSPVPIRANIPIEDVFSANFAKQIVRNEELLFSIMMIQNALELGQPEIALAQCKKALGRR